MRDFTFVPIPVPSPAGGNVSLINAASDYGADPTNTVSSSAALAAAAADAATDKAILWVPPGTYRHDQATTIHIDGAATLRGAGKQATQFRVTNAAGRIAFGLLTDDPDTAGWHGDFTVSGTDVATNPVLIARGARRNWLSMSVTNAAVDNVRIEALQNSSFYGCDFRGAGQENLVIDVGAKNIDFYNLTLSTAGRWNLRFDMTASHPVNPDTVIQCEHICFYGGMFEEPGVNQYCIVNRSATDVNFFGTRINGDPGAPAAVLLTRIEHPTLTGWLDVDSTFVGGFARRGTAVFEVKGVNAQGQNAQLHVTGGFRVNSPGNTGFLTDDLASVYVGENVRLAVGTVWSGTGLLTINDILTHVVTAVGAP